MKKLLTLLALTGIIFLSHQKVSAQCASPVLDSVCFSSLLTTGGGICLDSLPPAMARHYYSQDVSFVMPKRISVTSPISTDVDLREITVTGMSGAPSFPAGLNWTCDTLGSGPCFYLPQTGENLGAIRFCGTPLVPGDYTITVYIRAKVYVLAIGSELVENQTYVTRLKVLPDTSSGFAYEYCDSGSYNFGTTISYPNNPTKYEWNFGNGNRSTLQNPGIQTYPDTGTYTATLKITTYQYRVTGMSITNASGWSGDIEELTNACSSFLGIGRPDLIYKFTDFGYTSSEKTDQCPTVTWTGVNVGIPIGQNKLRFQTWDVDTETPIIGSPSDLLATDSVNLGIGTFPWVRGSNSGTITMDTIVGLVIYDTTIIKVLSNPTAPVLFASNDTICSGDSVVMSVYSSSDLSYQWFKDSTAIALAEDTFLIVRDPGVYYVVLTNSSTGCAASSRAHRVTRYAAPPALAVNPVAPGKIANTNFPGTGYTIQWYKNGVMIPGANAVVLDHDGDGAYTCVVSNNLYPACSTTSAPLVISGIETFENIQGLNIFPNPTEGILNVAFETFQTEDITIQVSDMWGRIVGKQKFANQLGKHTANFDLSDVSRGVYLVQVAGAAQLISKIVVVK